MPEIKISVTNNNSSESSVEVNSDKITMAQLSKISMLSNKMVEVEDDISRTESILESITLSDSPNPKKEVIFNFTSVDAGDVDTENSCENCSCCGGCDDSEDNLDYFYDLFSNISAKEKVLLVEFVNLRIDRLRKKYNSLVLEMKKVFENT